MEAMSTSTPRPRQVTMATVMAVIGSLVLVISLVDSLGRIRTPETRRAIDEFLAQPPGSGLGVETAQVVDGMRLLAYVSGALAAVALVLGIFLLQRHRGARIGLTVIAALLLVTMPVAGLMPLFIATAAALVWSRPARDWYAGRAPATADGSVAGATEPTHPAFMSEERPRDEPAGQRPAWPPPPAGQDPPTEGQWPPPGQPAAPSWPAPEEQPAQSPAPSLQGPPTGATAWPPPAYRDPGTLPWGGPPPADRRPVTVTVAAILTWIGAGLVAALMGLTALVLTVSADEFVDQVDRVADEQGVAVSRDEALALGWGMAATMLAWALIAILLAIFAFRRSNAARIALAVSAVMTALLSMITILTGISILFLLLSGAVLVLLFTGGANGWYARAGSTRSGGPGGPGGAGQGPYGQGPYGQGPYGSAPEQPGPDQPGPHQPGPAPYPGSYGAPPEGPTPPTPPPAPPEKPKPW